MKSSALRFVSTALAGMAIFLGTLILVQSYIRLTQSTGDANHVLLVAQMEMIAGSVILASGVISMAILSTFTQTHRPLE